MDNDKRMLEEVLAYYQKGKSLSDIASKCDISIWYLKKILDDFKESCRINGKMYNKELKIIIANRDKSGISRRSISKELNVSETLIGVSCEMYGQATKKQVPINNLYIEIEGTYDLASCPHCKSKRVRSIKDGVIERLTKDKNGLLVKRVSKTEGIYCLDCSNEFFYFATDKEENKTIYMLNWEYF